MTTVILFTAQERAELSETPDDNRPLAPDEIAGPTLFSLVSLGTELANYTGLGGKFPIRPGYAALFKIEKAGAEVKDLAMGSAIFCMGPHASHQRCRRQDAVPVPAGLSPETAPFCRLVSVSMSTLTTTRARPPAQAQQVFQDLLLRRGAQLTILFRWTD